MKKRLIILFVFLLSCFLISCDTSNNTTNNQTNETPSDSTKTEDTKDYELSSCNGYDNYFVVGNVCYPIPEVVSDTIRINDEVTIVEELGSQEQMTDFVADLSGSTGLAVIPRDAYELRNDVNNQAVLLSGDDDTETENIIVKLTEEGFFEEVSFSDDQGLDVDITSNPLALEVYGEFTVVIFEVNFNGNMDNSEDFTQKIYNSLYAGGIYLIHNETGKIFATKEVEFKENTYTYTEDHSRMVNISVTLNEPIKERIEVEQVDEFGNQLLDDEGKPLYEIVEELILDSEGNEIIFTEGPILTEFIESPIYEYYEVPRLDEEGNKLFDEEGKPIIDIEQVAILDEEGNPIIEMQEVPILDEDGHPVYQETFNMEFWIEEIIDVTYTEYSAETKDNPLTVIAQRFVDKIISEYYNWDYYRVNNYRLEGNSFANTDDAIFYMHYSYEGSEEARYIKKLYFDSDTEEIVIENYLNATLAGLDQCEIMIDPINNHIICKTWDQNMKIYSQEYGLKTIPESSTLNAVTFPNGELYFYDYQEQYVDELGYQTTVLYTLTEDGNLSPHFIELGERQDVCTGECLYYVQSKLYTEDGIMYQEYGGVTIMMGNGNPVFHSADLEIAEIGEFESSREVCDNSNGCWYETLVEIVDTEGEVLYTYKNMGNYYPQDTPPNYVERYVLDDSATIEYYIGNYAENDVCDSEIGCSNGIQLFDESIGNDGLSMWQNFIFEDGEELISNINIPVNNQGVYEYERVVEDEVCTESSCDRYIEILFYDEQDNLFYESGKWTIISQGEQAPLRIEYHLTDDTQFINSTNVCTEDYCYAGYQVDDIYFEYTFEKDDLIYENIIFAETDKTVINSYVETSEICTQVDGCWIDEVIYEIKDGEATIYEFNSAVGARYGDRVPFKVTIDLSETNVTYKQTYHQADAVCEEDVCYRSVQVYLEGDIDPHGEYQMMFSSGDLLISKITLPNEALVYVGSQQICESTEGCILYSNNYTIVDELGNPYSLPNDSNYNESLAVFFAYGEAIPNDQTFEVTFEMSNLQYRKYRMSVHEFIYRMDYITILDENLFFIEQDSWTQGNDNYIMTYDETTNRYVVKYTNITAVNEITKFQGSYIAINDDGTAIIKFTYNEAKSTDDYYYFDQVNLTEDLQINEINDLIVDYDGSIYFKGVDNFIQVITGSIDVFGEVHIDTEVVDIEIIRVRPIN